ncbi:vestitone reductase-like [Morus notabilis]|uniref:vestitone reductase-like n=1 Tax=Morus notabilis TaxID=981085 RepID=UPI000CECF40A|nr:vestitone reductase-like [Morus notabilis]
MEGEKGMVCVTGGTEYTGSWLIMRLLDHGYSVRTIVKSNPEHKKDLSFLTSLPGATERLKIFDADLSNPESLKAAIEGCIGVFLVATPIDIGNQETEEVVIKRSIDGAIGIVQACLDSKTVKKVMYTSSSAAVLFNGKGLDEMDETFWTDIDYVKSLKSNAASYLISKTLTEKAVLEFSEKHGLEVATLVLCFISGPFILPEVPRSVQSVFEMVFGDKSKPNSLTRLDLVHVDDVARALIFLFENPEAKGRYNCSADTISVESTAKLFSTKYSELRLPSKSSLVKMEVNWPSLSTKKLLDSGFQFKYGVEEIFNDAIECCKEKGYL